MTATARLRDRFATDKPKSIKLVGASGQIGYGIPDAAFREALSRKPDMIGGDMGSTDIGPYFLGSGEMATSPIQTRRDLRRLLGGAREIDVPLIIGTAGSAGAGAHLDATLDIVRDIAKADGLHFRMAIVRSDISRDTVRTALREGRISPLGSIDQMTEADIEEAANIVGQAGTEAFVRALATDPDVIIAGRACDTGIYTSVPEMLGFPTGLAFHLAKIIECASLCCLPGGRDSILGTLDHEGFVLESMNPVRAATPMSVAAHSLYEQSDPYVIIEPEGTAHVDSAHYEAIDDRRTRVTGSRFEKARQLTVKLEGSARVGERAVLLAGSSDPRFIAGIKEIVEQVKDVVQGLVCDPGEEPDYDLSFRTYGLDAVYPWPNPPQIPPREIFVMAEVIAPSRDRAMAVAKSTKQYLLHHGFPGRLSTSGNLAFPFAPPELSAGTAYRFNMHHLMAVDDLAPLFPVEVEEL